MPAHSFSVGKFRTLRQDPAARAQRKSRETVPRSHGRQVGLICRHFYRGMKMGFGPENVYILVTLALHDDIFAQNRAVGGIYHTVGFCTDLLRHSNWAYVLHLHLRQKTPKIITGKEDFSTNLHGPRIGPIYTCTYDVVLLSPTIPVTDSCRDMFKAGGDCLPVACVVNPCRCPASEQQQSCHP